MNSPTPPSVSVRIKELLDKSKHYDADERFMAVQDLINTLKQSPAQVEQQLQVPIRDSILRLLDDGSSDVATAAVKCLSQLVTKLSNEQVAYIVDRLGSLITLPSPATGGAHPTSTSANATAHSFPDDTDDHEHKGSNLDIVTDGLQTIISSSSLDNGRLIAPKLISALVLGLAHPPQKEIDREMSCLTILKQLCERFGADVSEQHEAIMNTLIALLQHPAEAVKKRASVTLAPLVLVLSDPLFQALMSTLIRSMSDSASPEIYIQSVSAISRSAGVRVGSYLSSIMPRLNAFLTLTEDEKRGEEEPEERRIEMLEICLQAIESIILRCPTKVTPYVDELVSKAIELSMYDPMYNYDDEETDEEEDDSMTDAIPSSKKGKKRQKKKKAADKNKRQPSSGDQMSDDDTQHADANGWGDADTDGDDDDWGTATTNDDEWGAEDEDSGGISAGANDTSWKVRRAAVGVLAAFIKARSDLLKQYYDALCDHLVSRMKERDSAVKEELLLACRDLLHESVVAARAEALTLTALSLQRKTSDDLNPFAHPPFIRTRSTYQSLDTKTAAIIHSVEKQFAGADIRTQKAIFAVLVELFQVKHGQLAPFLPKLIPHILRGIEATGRAAEVNADALLFIHLILESHSVDQVAPYLSTITIATVKAIKQGLPKNIPSALTVLTAISKLLKQAQQQPQYPTSLTTNATSSAPSPAFNSTQIAKDIFRVVFHQLELNDVPLDVKLSSIQAISVLMASAGQLLSPAEIKRIWPVFADRMMNETTCQPTLRAVSKMANSDQAVDCSPIVKHIDTMVAFIRKNTHHLRHDTVRCLEGLIRSRPAAFTTQHISLILTEVSPYVDDSDLHLSHLVLDLISTILTTTPTPEAILNMVSSTIVEKAIVFACSPLLQGASLHSLIVFFRLLIIAKQRVTTCTQEERSVYYQSMLNALFSHVVPTLNKNAFTALSKCIAAIILASNSTADRERTMQTMMQDIQREKSIGLDGGSSHVIQIDLLVIGEIGRACDVSYLTGFEHVCVKAFDSNSEGVRSAAAFALGNISIGSMQKSLPILIQLIQQQNQKYGYLLFTALKEIIVNYSSDHASMIAFQPYLPTITPLLFEYAHANDEATRTMVSECLGRIAVIDPKTILPRLEPLISNKQASVRTVVITALRFSFTPLMDYTFLSQHLHKFLQLVNDHDLEVVRQTILTINALFGANVEMIRRDTLQQLILPALYKETKVRPELIKEIDYGAFKKMVDDGKPLRKASFQALATLLDQSPHRLDLHRLISALQLGLCDQEDIQVSSYQTFTQLALQHPSVVLETLDALPKLIMTPIKQHIATAKGKEGEMALECLRACVRAMLTFNQIQGVELCTQYTHFYKQVCATPLLAQMIKDAQKT